MQKIIYTEKGLPKAANQLLQHIPKNSCVCFSGSMGAGKTTLIKALVKALGGAQPGNSPTFGIVNEYSYPDGQVLGYHFDFYRVETPEEVLDMGLEEYLSQGVWLFIEWPEKAGNLLPNKRVDIALKSLDSETRELRFTAH